MFKDEGYQLMGAAFEVYNQLGYGMAEEVYQQSLEIELGLRQIPFQSKAELVVSYKNRELQTKYRPDLFVFGSIIVELIFTDNQSSLVPDLRSGLSEQPSWLLRLNCPVCSSHRRRTYF